MSASGPRSRKVGDGSAELQGCLGCHRLFIGYASDAIGSKELSCHLGKSPLFPFRWSIAAGSQFVEEMKQSLNISS